MTIHRNHRLFLAIWPSATAHHRVAQRVKDTHWQSETKLVKPEQWHVTLHFIGSVSTARLNEIAQGLAVPFEPFYITMNRSISWGHLTVLEPNTISEPLIHLHKNLAQALHQLELPVESRPFRPHLTLARSSGSRAQPRQSGVVAEQAIAPIRWKVKGYCLVESMLSKASAYRVIRDYQAQK
ncbi:MAG: RNA 2',3'-cyclic phosphodiesterase [Burkholderiaceae bacterium]|nr:RNA 2',3'-cyclic phosphodiesterase [Burkholderiaceae bacterium]